MNIFKKFYYYFLSCHPYSVKNFTFLLDLYRRGEKDSDFALKCLANNIRYHGFTNETVRIFIDSALDILDVAELPYYKLPLILIQSLIEQEKYDEVEELMEKYTFSESCYISCLLPRMKNGDKNVYNLMLKAFASDKQAMSVFSTFVFDKILLEQPEIVKDFIVTSEMKTGKWNIYLIEFIYRMWPYNHENKKELLRLYLAYNYIEDTTIYPFVKEYAKLRHQLYISNLRFLYDSVAMKQREVNLYTKIEKMLAQGKTQKEVFEQYKALLVNVVYTLSFFARITYLLPDYAEVFSGIAQKLYEKKFHRACL